MARGRRIGTLANTITVYTETLDQSMQWSADMAHSYLMASAPGNQDWPEMAVAYDDRNPALFGVLSMGVGMSYPFSFVGRDFPTNASKEVTQLYLHADAPHNPSFLTKDDLEGKLGELMIIPDQKALACRAHVQEILRSFPARDVPSEHQRIVFWFGI